MLWSADKAHNCWRMGMGLGVRFRCAVVSNSATTAAFFMWSRFTEIMHFSALTGLIDQERCIGFQRITIFFYFGMPKPVLENSSGRQFQGEPVVTMQLVLRQCCFVRHHILYWRNTCSVPLWVPVWFGTYWELSLLRLVFANKEEASLSILSVLRSFYLIVC